MECVVKNNVQVEINNDIFKYLDPNDNVILSDINSSDRNYVVYLLRNYYLSLRNSLNLDKNITFGLEIEFENARRSIIELELAKYFPNKDWKVVDDRSLFEGGEINSPKLRDSEQTWIDLSLVCDIVSNNSFVLDNTSAHVHIGTQILGNNPKYWDNFVQLWMTYENIIFRFLYGEFASPRKHMNEQARPISSDLITKLDDIRSCGEMINAYPMFQKLNAGRDFIDKRKRSVNFTNISKLSPYQYNQELPKNTIEFRSPNGTFDPVIWQNNVNLLVHLFMYAKSDKFNMDIIERRRKQIIASGIPSNMKEYSNVYIEQAIELADLIFTNNLDKIYFLRQYIKSYEVSSKPLARCKKFTNYVNSRISA